MAAVLHLDLLGKVLVNVGERGLGDAGTAHIGAAGARHGGLIPDVELQVIVAHLNIALIVGDVDAITKVEIQTQRRLTRVAILARAAHVQLAEHVLVDGPRGGRISANFNALVHELGRAVVDIHAKIELQVQIIHVGESQLVVISGSILEELAVVEVLLQVDVAVAGADGGLAAANRSRRHLFELRGEELGARGRQQVEVIIWGNGIGEHERFFCRRMQVCGDIVVAGGPESLGTRQRASSGRARVRGRRDLPS